MRIGLTGGIGSGKSEVARVWAELGAYVVDADVSAREAVAPGSPGLARIAALWPGVIGADGALDRAMLGRIVFADDAELRRLEAIVHPLVRTIGARLEARAPKGAPIVHVVPLLFESGFGERCDRTVVVVASEATRVARVVRRDGVDEAAVRRRMNRQISIEEARRRADDVLENDADLTTLVARAGALYERLTGPCGTSGFT